MQSVKEEGRPVKSESENIYGTLLLWGGLWRMFCYIDYIYIVPVASRSFLTGSQKKEQSPLCPFLCKVSDPSLGIYIYTFHGIKNNALPTSLGPTWLKMIILQEFGEQLLLFQWVPTILAKVKPWYVSQSRVLIVIPSDSPDFVPSTNHSCLGASGLITDILGSSR